MRLIGRAVDAMRPRTSSARAEAYRDWIFIGVINNGALAVLAFLKPSGVLIILSIAALSVGVAMGGLTILHHGGHGRFSRNYFCNMAAVHVAAPLGFWVAHWGAKHRVHHRLPAVYPEDSFTKLAALRLHPDAPVYRWHRFQHYYAWIIYCLAWPGDLGSQLRFLANGQVPGISQPFSLWWRTRTFILEKIIVMSIMYFYIGLAENRVLVLTALGLALLVGGLLASCIVVIGHINLGLQYRPAEAIARDWTGHVMSTTASFSTANRFLGWLAGGMTLHVAHHLRPMASRRQLRRVHVLLVSSQQASGGPALVEFDTLSSALRAHWLTLKGLSAAIAADKTAPHVPRRSIIAEATTPGVSIIGK